MYDLRARLLVFIMADPHFLERSQRRQDGTSNPHRILSLSRRNAFNSNRGWSQLLHFMRQSLVDSWKHSRAATQHNIRVQVSSNINVTVLNRFERHLVNTRAFTAKQIGLKQRLSTSESFCSNGDHTAIRQFVILLHIAGGLSLLHLVLVVQRNIRQLLLNISHNFAFSRAGEGVSSFGQYFGQILGQIATSNIQSRYSMRQRIAFVNRHSVRYSIACIHDNSRGTSR
mmetsp:Transcript_1750/g.2836  ORF Transcript_1750/g.2836 Transcript_1750/m.2836 type:complete len:228 (+) Transcript_1750:372-1055(+)